MSIRRLMAMAAGGLVMTLGAGQPSPLHAQGGASVEADAEILREISARNVLEIRLGELTRKKTTQPRVRDFGDRMITEHTNMHRQLTAVVGKEGKVFKPRSGQMEVGEITRLEKVPANEFDREYMATMIRHHQDNVNFFQNAANTARSPQVRELLASGLPVQQQHLDLAVQVGSVVGAAPAVAGQNPPAPGQNPPVAGDNTPGRRENLKKDSKFIREAVADNTLEIRLAQLSETKTTNPGIRQLAQRVLADHTAMQNRWISLASSNGMNLKPGMGRRHLEKAKRLEKASAREFDRAYATMLIQNNQDYVEYFGKEGRAAQSAQVRNLVETDLPTLQQHLSTAKQVGIQLGVDTTAALRARHVSSYK